MAYTTASAMWSSCDSIRQPMLTRVERYAQLTIPKVCYPTGYNQLSSDDSHDYQSAGAQAVNHLCNKLMLAMFAPSRPFLKLQPGKKAKAQAAGMQLTETQLGAILAQGEREAIAELDRRAQRPKLFQIMRHLVIAGNVLIFLGKEEIRVIGLRNFIVKRNITGGVMHIVIKETLKFDELDQKVRDLYKGRYQDDSSVAFYKWVKREDNGTYSMTQWLDEKRLPKEFNGRWPAGECPYNAITWDLADEADYGTGLVEEYIGDFEAMSVLAESVVDGAVLGTEYRWMVNPTGQTSIEDVNNSENGDALPGLPTDVAPTQGGNPVAIQVAQAVGAEYEKRISRGFLLGSAVIRDAERVTQEEVRLTAMELETSFGGVYSTLAASLQTPIAKWLFKAIDLNVKGADFEVTIITGLDALSRNGDLENFRAAMADMAAVTSVPPELAARMKWQEVAAFIGQGRGIELSRFILTDAEYAAKVQQQQENQVGQEVATAAGTAAVSQQGPQ